MMHILTANLRALAILFSIRLSIAPLKSLKKALSWACSNFVGAQGSYALDHNEVVYITGGCGEDIKGEMFHIKAP